MRATDETATPAHRPLSAILRGRELLGGEASRVATLGGRRNRKRKRGRETLETFIGRKGLTLLLSGHPGAGKTTFGLYLLHQLTQEISGARRSRSQASASRTPASLVLSLVEDPEQIDRICQIYGFGFERNEVYLVPPSVMGGSRPAASPATESTGKDFYRGSPAVAFPDLSDLASQLGFKFEPGSLLMVDGAGLMWNAARRRSLLRFLEQAKDLGLFSILVAEDDRRYDDSLGYFVDGILRLEVKPSAEATVHPPRRSLEILKLRWHDYYFGSHSFALRQTPGTHGGSEVQLFPSMDCLTGERRRTRPAVDNAATAPASAVNHAAVPSGVDGFDDLFGSPSAPFARGELGLLIGPTGAGKFEFGTQFLAAAGDDEESIFVSFVRDFEEVVDHVAGLPAPDHPCLCLHFSPASVIVEEMAGAVVNLLEAGERKGLASRVFIDGLSALSTAFAESSGFAAFLVSFLKLLATFPRACVLVSFDTPRVFASYAEVDLPASSSFATIIGLSFQERFNRLVHGIVVVKSPRPCDSGLKVATLVGPARGPRRRMQRLYAVDPRASWPQVGLLGGERERVREHQSVIGLFIETRQELAVVHELIAPLQERFGDSLAIRTALDEDPEPVHWSFRGAAPAAQTATRVVELRASVMDALRGRGMLLEVPEEILLTSGDRFDPGFLISPVEAGSARPRFTVPSYADVGVLACRHATSPKSVSPPPSTWKELMAMAGDSGPYPVFVIPNAVTEPRSFVSFFFELSWSFGWSFSPPAAVEELLPWLTKWVTGDDFRSAALLLQELVNTGDGKAIPSPLRGGDYRRSRFSRRWLSQILPAAGAQPSAANERARFSIAPLPGLSRQLPGISNVEIYSFGVVRGSLVPEAAWALVSQLLSTEADIERATRKSGVTVSRRLYRTHDIEDGLCRPPLPTGVDRNLMPTYPRTLNQILLPKVGREARFRRASDIPRYFALEKLLARMLVRIFERPLKEVTRDIVEQLEQIYIGSAV